MKPTIKKALTRYKETILTTFIAMFMLMTTVGVALSVDVKNSGKTYHTAEVSFTFLGGIRG